MEGSTPARVPVLAGEPALTTAVPADPGSGGASPELEALAARLEGSRTWQDWRHLAERAEAQGAYTLAAQAYAREAECWDELGRPNEAYIERAKAARWATTLEVYHWRRASPDDRTRSATGARLEPDLGCLIGAFIDRDQNLGALHLEGQKYGNPEDFGRLAGRMHASHFMYRAYGQPFPGAWARELKRHGIIPQIAWEPSSLEQVRDDGYLRSFVEEVRALDWPVFIRFAGEMNGDWTRYGGNPAAYIQKFRLVSSRFRSAPKAAMLWCPNTIPEARQDLYYPGDDAVDWVGVNMYSVLFADERVGDPASDRTHQHPEDLLRRIYQKYSERKPIAIGEYAATQRSRAEGRDRAGFSMLKMKQLYRVLPTRYPRVKLISWYNCDNITFARPGRQLNNYLLTAPAPVLDTYRSLIQDPWFLSACQDGGLGPAGQTAGWTAVPARERIRLTRGDVIEASVRSHVDAPEVYFLVGGSTVHASRDPAANRLDTTSLEPGLHELEVRVQVDGHCLERETLQMEVL